MNIPDCLMETWYYLNSIYVPRHVIASSLGSLAGIATGILKGKDAKTCFKYGVVGGISVVALAEVHDLETVVPSLEQMVKTYNTGYIEKAIEATVTSENLGDTIVTQVKSTYEVIKVAKEYAVSDFLQRFVQSAYEDILDLVGGVIGALSISTILYYPVKKINAHKTDKTKYSTKNKISHVISTIKDFDNKIIEKLIK